MTTKGAHSSRNELAESLHNSDQSRGSQQSFVDYLRDNRSHILSHQTLRKKKSRLLGFLITIVSPLCLPLKHSARYTPIMIHVK